MKTKRADHAPQNETLAFLQEQEIRSHLQRLRAEHAAKAADSRTPMSDQARAADPVLAVLNQAIADYGPDKEPLLRAIERPPYPVEILPPSIVAQGMAQLARNLSPERVADLNTTRAMASAYTALTDGVIEAIQAA